MSDMPSLPLWDVLNLNGISLVLTGVLALLLEDERREAEAWDDLPPLKDPYAEI